MQARSGPGFWQAGGVIASVAFQRFKALRNTQVALAPFNLVIGPNGSGKTSLIQALLRLRTLARLPLRGAVPDTEREIPEGAEITFAFAAPYDGLELVMSCVHDAQCDLLQVVPLPTGEGSDNWPGLRAEVLRIRSYELDHRTMLAPVPAREGAELSVSGSNLAAVVATMQERATAEFTEMRADFVRVLPEFDDIVCAPRPDGTIELGLKLTGDGERVTAENLSEGTLHALAMFVLAYDPTPPSIICIEDIDHGIHPRLLRDVRDALYRLSYPQSCGSTRPPVQVIATTHSPYLLDLFREHPEEIVVSDKHGTVATFTRLADRGDLGELLTEGSLGDMWYAGLLGGVPERRGNGA